MFEPCSACGNEDADFVEVTDDGDAIFLCDDCGIEDIQSVVPVNLKTFVWEELK